MSLRVWLPIAPAAAAFLTAACVPPPAPVAWSEIQADEREAIFLTQRGHGTACPVRRDRFDPPRAVPAAVDSAAIVDRLVGWDGPSGSVLLSVRTDSVAVDTFRPLESELDDAATAALLDTLRGHVGPTEGRGWAGRLRIEVGHAPSVRAGYALECAPTLTNRREMQATLQALVSQLPAAVFPAAHDADGNRRPGTRRVVGWYRVGEDGVVLETRVWRTSGDRRVDEVVEQIAPVLRFRPAMLDGAPVAVWVQFPLILHR